MDVWTYFHQRDRELTELSLTTDPTYGSMYSEEAGSDGKRGRIFGLAFLTEDAFMQVHELVQVVDDHVHREEYGYFLIIDHEEVFGYERDPTHDPPVHCHYGRDHVRTPCGPISFKDCAELAWDEVTKYHERLFPRT